MIAAIFSLAQPLFEPKPPANEEALLWPLFVNNFNVFSNAFPLARSATFVADEFHRSRKRFYKQTASSANGKTFRETSLINYNFPFYIVGLNIDMNQSLVFTNDASTSASTPSENERRHKD